jgi:ABC-2 type transport system permease protein
MGRLLIGFLSKDAKLFCVDRQAVVMSFIIPMLVASILGWLDSTASKSDPHRKIPFLFVDNDKSAISKSLLKDLAKEDNLNPSQSTDAAAHKAANEGGTTVVIIPKGFGGQAISAMSGKPKAIVQLLTDPADPSDGDVVKGELIGDASRIVAKEVFGALAGSAAAPLQVTEQEAAAHQANWGQAAHDFAGFGLMGLLFFSIESAVVLVRDRRLGIWRRLRASPVPPQVFLLSRAVSSTVITLAILAVMFSFGALLFGIRVLGSLPGFLLVALATALMASTFGLFIATFGRSETQARGVSILFIFLMLATGGAWFPLSRMPDYIQKGALYLPVRWAVEGLDAMTWRGLGFTEGLRYAGVLGLFALIFAFLALLGYRRLAKS